MSTGAAQSGGAAAAEQSGAQAGAVQDEPTVQDDGFSPEERAQFEAMEREQPAPAAPAAGEGDKAPATGADQKGAAPAGGAEGAGGKQVAGASADDEDDDGEQAGAAQPGADGKPPPRRVNYGKFRRMEEKASTLEQTLQEERNNRIRLEERLTLINEALAPKEGAKQQQEEEAEPDPEKDVFGWIRWSQRRAARLEDEVRQLREGNQQTNDEREIATSYENDARAFAAQEPNFGPAYQFLMGSRVMELAWMNYGKDVTQEGVRLTPEEVRAIQRDISAEERELVQNAIKNRQSPAQAIFRMARIRGFRPAAAGEGGQQNGGAQQGGQQQGGGQKNGVAPGGAPGKPPSVKDEIDRLKAGQESSLSLSQGGGAPNSPLTPEKLLSMSDEEFGNMLETLSEAQQRQLLGA